MQSESAIQAMSTNNSSHELIAGGGHLKCCFKNHASAAACSMNAYGTHKSQHLSLEVIALLLVSAAVYHMHNVIDGDGGLSNVGSQDDLSHSRWGPLENVLLVHHGDVGVHWHEKVQS